MISVFISHASEDNIFASRLADDLGTHNFHARTFRNLLPSRATLSEHKLDKRLEKAIVDDAFFIPVLSPASVTSKWVNIEIETALRAEARRKQIAVIPALVGRCSPPEILGLRSPSDFTRSYEKGFQDLLARLSAPQTQLSSKTRADDAALQISEGVTQDLLTYVARNPKGLYKLDPRKFEQLVAEVLCRYLQLEVQLTSSSRDGGVDIVLFGGRSPKDTPILVQCKRYSPERRVGVEVIRSLCGAMLIENVKRGVIVTTSSFTKAAAEETRRLSTFSRDRLTLELVDYSKLLSWLTRTSDLSPDVTMPVRQIRERYAELVNKKFQDTLTSGEKTELQRLADVLDQADAPFYEPLKNALRKERDRLITESRGNLESHE